MSSYAAWKCLCRTHQGLLGICWLHSAQCLAVLPDTDPPAAQTDLSTGQQRWIRNYKMSQFPGTKALPAIKNIVGEKKLSATRGQYKCISLHPFTALNAISFFISLSLERPLPLARVFLSSRSWMKPANIWDSMKTPKNLRMLFDATDLRKASLWKTRSPRSFCVINRE